MVPAWVGPYMAARYRLGGRGPEEYDCYGLPRRVLLDRARIELPAQVDGAPTELDRRALADALAGRERGWTPVADRPSLERPLHWHRPPRALDVALMRTGRFPCHLGVLVAPDLVLHIERDRGVHVDRIDQIDLAPRLVGIYRHPDLT